MKKQGLALFILFLSSLFSNSVFSQCMMVPVSLNQRVTQSSYVVEGTVVTKETFIDAVTGNVYTLNKVAIKAWLKNAQQNAYVYVRTEGGVYKNKATTVYPSLQLHERSNYVLFLAKATGKTENAIVKGREKGIVQTIPYAGAQGAITENFGMFTDAVMRTTETERDLLQKIKTITRQDAVTALGKKYEPTVKNVIPARALAITSISPATTRSGTTNPSDQITISGSGFGTTPGVIYFANADDGGATFVASGLGSDIISWSDNTIVAKVLSEAGTGPVIVDGTHVSPSNLTIQFSHISIENTFFNYAQTTRQRYYLRNLNGTGGYTFQLNTSFAANTAASTAFTNAVSSWRNTTGVNFTVSGTTAVATSADDNVNAIYFNASIPAGTLAICTSNFRASAIPVTCEQENTVWWLSDMDIQFRDVPTASTTWQYGPAAPASNQYDFQSVAVHELGHAHGLGHVIAPGQVMHYAIGNGVMARTLSANDIAAGIAKLNYSDDPTCFNPSGSGSQMVSASGGTLPVSFLNINAKRTSKSSVDVSWTTALEYNNKGFTVERGETAQRFSSLGFVNSKGQSALQQQYLFNDGTAGPYAWYYRITQNDFNGKSMSSATVYVNGDVNKTWKVWSNESGQVVQVYVQSMQNKKITFQLFTATGQLVQQQQITNSRTIISTDHIAKGYYSYRITDGDEIISGKLMLGK